MPLGLFETFCIVIILLTLGMMARARPWPALLADYLTLAVAAWLGEQSCIVLYHFYAYAPGWHGRLDEVPVLVPLIWPLVVLSARQVARALWPSLQDETRPVAAALAVGLLVAVDASLVEVLAVRAGLWSWAEAGHLGVPLIGILGWGYFAAGAELCLAGPSSRASAWGRRALLVLVAPLCAHALIQLSWWGLFRWALRGPLGDASLVGLGLLGALALGWVLSARRRGSGIPLGIALPRAVAALLFFSLLVTAAPGDARLWLHTLIVAIPYCAATRWSLSRVPRLSPG